MDGIKITLPGLLVKGFGISLIFLAIWRLFGNEIDVILLSCLAISATLLTFSDAISFYMERKEKENRVNFKRIRKKWIILIKVMNVLNVLAIWFIIAGPQMQFIKQWNFVTPLGESASLLGLGVVVYIIGTRQGVIFYDFLDKQSNVLGEQIENLNALEKLNNSINKRSELIEDLNANTLKRLTEISEKASREDVSKEEILEVITEIQLDAIQTISKIRSEKKAQDKVE